MSIAVYCGSFDPLHIGHLTFIKETLKSHLVKRIIVVPTKDYWNKKVHSKVQERLETINSLGIEDIITDIRYSEFNYTYELMRQVQIDYPSETLFLMLGADNLKNLNKWRNFEELLNYHLIIMKRDEFDIVSLMKQLNSENYTILDCDKVDVSSTYIRNNKEKAEHLLAKPQK